MTQQSGYRFFIFVTLLLIGIFLYSPTKAEPPPGADPTLHSWFERQHSVKGVWCCDVSDGSVLEDNEWRTTGDHYEVWFDNTWHTIPDTALRDPDGGENPTHKAVLWRRGDTIYCFAPGFGG